MIIYYYGINKGKRMKVKNEKKDTFIYIVPAVVLVLNIIVYIIWAYATFPPTANGVLPAGYEDTFVFTLMYIIVSSAVLYAIYYGVVFSITKTKHHPTAKNLRKTALLLGGLLGVTGAHDFYRKKYLLGFIHLALFILTVVVYNMFTSGQIGFDASTCYGGSNNCIKYTPNATTQFIPQFFGGIVILNIGWALIETYIWIKEINKNKSKKKSYT